MTMKAAIQCSKCDNLIDSPIAAGQQLLKSGAALALAICAACAPFHCLGCKTRTSSLNLEIYAMENGNKATRGVCATCGRKKNRTGAIAALAAA